MELIHYLNENFYNEKELLKLAKIDNEILDCYQKNNMMPKPSYKLSLHLDVSSYFGFHTENCQVNFYAKGYLAWLSLIQDNSSEAMLFDLFSNRYQTQIQALKTQGYDVKAPEVNTNLNLQIKNDWLHFLDGTYGLCTHSGLPEAIATKGLIIFQIKELLEKNKLNESEHHQLEKAVNLLDKIIPLFAPHERIKSSRHRYIDEVREMFQFDCAVN